MENKIIIEQKKVILDSYAGLAYLEDEKGGKFIEGLLREAREKKKLLYMTVVNLGEVIYITERERGLDSAQLVLSRVKELPIKLVNINENIALTAAHIKAKYPIAYADCFAVSLTIILGGILITGDPEFREVEEEVDLFWI